MVSEMPDPGPRRDYCPLHSAGLGLSYRHRVERVLRDAAHQSRRLPADAGTALREKSGPETGASSRQYTAGPLDGGPGPKRAAGTGRLRGDLGLGHRVSSKGSDVSMAGRRPQLQLWRSRLGALI